MDSGFSLGRRSPVVIGEDSPKGPSQSSAKLAEVPGLPQSVENTKQLQKKVTYLSRTMHHNLQAAMLRGDDLAEMERKASSLELGSKAFTKTAVTVHKKVWWEEQKHGRMAVMALAAVVALMIAWILIKNILDIDLGLFNSE